MSEKLVHIDLETTGLDTSTCEVIECAYSLDGPIHQCLYSASIPVPPEVSGVTNIDNVDLQGMPLFQDSTVRIFLQDLAISGYIAVTHNTDFDLAVLKRYGIKFQSSICTYKIAWKLFKDKLANQKLGTLRAHFGIPYSGEAHRADYDVKILIEVFNALRDRYDFNPIEKMVAASDKAKFDFLNVFPFGKFKGHAINPENPEHLSYIKWLLYKADFDLDQKFKDHITTLFQSEEFKN